jgi:hypothetical protein
MNTCARLHILNMQYNWINNLFVTDKKGELVKLNGEKLRRSKEIDAYAKACLKVRNGYNYFEHILFF